MKKAWLLFFIPVLAFAQPKPQSISTCEELQNIQNDPVRDYQLVNDIDCKGREFTIIPSFFASLSGLNEQNNSSFEIRNLILKSKMITDARDGSRNCAGIFCRLRGGYVHDIKFSNIRVENVGTENYSADIAVVAAIAEEDSYFENLEFNNILILTHYHGDAAGIVAGSTDSAISDRYLTFDNININDCRMQGDKRPSQVNPPIGRASHGFVVGSAGHSVINNVHVNNCTYDYQPVHQPRMGGIAGGVSGQISNSSVSNISIGSVTAPITDDMFDKSEDDAYYYYLYSAIGGLAGSFSGQLVNNRVENVSIYTNNIWSVGGLTGLGTPDFVKQNAVENLLISHCATDQAFNLGGLFGYLAYYSAYSELNNNYVQGQVKTCQTPSALPYQNLGGLIGEFSVDDGTDEDYIGFINNYAALSFKEIHVDAAANSHINGIIGKNNSRQVLSQGTLWDSTIAGFEYKQGDFIGIPTDQFANQAWLENLGWDFDSVWMLDPEKSSYPLFQYKHKI